MKRFLSGVRGALNCSVTFRIVFRVFQTVFRVIDSMIFLGGDFRGQFCSADVPP